MIYNRDCIEFMREREWTDLLITDIPYNGVNRESNGLRKLDKGKADELTFDLPTFLDLCYSSTKSTIIIFCGMNQVSEIFNYFDALAKKKKGTVRQLVWQKSNPSPMNGDYIYLSGLENAVWFKKKGGTFNAHCKSNVFKYPCGRSKIHPTEKNHELLKEFRMWNDGKGKTDGLLHCDNITNKHKIHTLTRKQDRSPNSGLIAYKDFCRYLTRRELEDAQTVPHGYTDCVSYLQAQDLLGDGWTIDVISHIFSFIPKE